MDESVPGRPYREFAWVWVWLALLSSIAIGVGVTTLLWGGTRTEHRDAFDTGWKSAAAVLAILAAVVTVERLRLGQREHRRQLVADRAKQDVEQAAHITALSSKASEQLGSEKAAVRIGGLTDLERLAQSYPQLRQTVADRLCAYLRAPYQPPLGRAVTAPRAQPAESTTRDPDGDSPTVSDEIVATSRLELDVRRTAQQILRRHLYWPRDCDDAPDSFWPDISLDLRDAILVDPDLSDCRIGSVDFRNASTYGDALFLRARFAGNALFGGAAFGGAADFGETHFMQRVSFGSAFFSEDVSFVRVQFAQDAEFSVATFDRNAGFAEAAFFGYAWLNGVRAKNADFKKVKFRQAEFMAASFAGIAEFSGSSFERSALFSGADFAESALFDAALFSEMALFDNVSFGGDASFEEVQFCGNVLFKEAAFGVNARFGKAIFSDRIDLGSACAIKPSAGHVWPPGWRAVPDSNGHGARLMQSTRFNAQDH